MGVHGTTCRWRWPASCFILDLFCFNIDLVHFITSTGAFGCSLCSWCCAAMASLESLPATHQGPIRLGLTGSVGMGKSTISNHFRKLGFHVFDADAIVHSLYGCGGEAEAVSFTAKSFPDVVLDNSINRSRLAAQMLDASTGKDNLNVVERIVHPLVTSKLKEFYEHAKKREELLVVYDLPLWFENGAAYDVDYIMVATADEKMQRERCLNRKGMNEEKLKTILAKQVAAATKRAQANFVVFTDKLGTHSQARAQTASFLQQIILLNSLKYESWVKKTTTMMIYRQPTPNSLLYYYDLVAFDIDQTICPINGRVSAGMNALVKYAESHMPKSAKKLHEEAKNGVILSRIKRENPLMAHDFTDLRRCVLEEIAKEHDETDKVNEGMRHFLAARSNIEPYLYCDALACIDWIRSEGLEVGFLTNGNCDVESYCPRLFSKLKFSLRAEDIGALKPSQIPFVAVAQRSGIPCCRILYIGDSYEHDVKGALAAGMGAALLTRPGESVGCNDVVTEYDADGKFVKLTSLNPEEMLRQIKHFF